MLNHLTDRSLRRIILSALAGTVLLSGCDQITERLERAKEVAETSAGQISGETVADASTNNLETASIDDRALAGTVMAEFVTDDEERPLFAIGSIIAKPKDIVDTAALEVDDTELSAEEIEYFEDEYVTDEPAAAPAEALRAPPPPEAAPAPAPEESASPIGGIVRTEKALPKITLDPRSAGKTERDIVQANKDVEQMAAEEPVRSRSLKRMTKDEFKALPVEEKAEIRKLARRAPVNREAMKKQLDANGVMLETMTKYGIGGEVALSRQGQMVIQIGADGASPTQYRGAGTSAGEFLVRADQAECPEGMQPADIGDDLALATACVVRDLRASGQFEYVEPDFIFQNQFVRRTKDAPPPTGAGKPPGGTTTAPTPTQPASFNPNDPLWALQWHFRDRGTTDGRTAGGAGFETFWNRQGTTGSRSVVVAVVDTGLQMSHPDIAGSPNIVAGWDMVSDPRMGNDGDGRDSDPNDPGDMCDPTKPYAADSFHGTHVAGTVGAAATNNGSGVAGGAWNVHIVPVRALGKCGGRLSDINDAIRWAAGIIPAEGPEDTEVWNENPADIINLSIGLLGACPASLQDAIDAATDKGAIVVSAAGNARMSTSFYAPAGCRNVVTVAASDARGQITPYSNFGPEVTLLAPGGDLTRDDNGDGKPDGVLSTKAAKNCYDPVTGQSIETCYYAYEQGTSMAAPHVSAALALLKARSPGASKEELLATLTGALDPRQTLQCSGLCSQYPGATPLADNPDMCARPCGTGLLNLANIPAKATGGGGK